jgi:hypothetical protein
MLESLAALLGGIAFIVWMVVPFKYLSAGVCGFIFLSFFAFLISHGCRVDGIAWMCLIVGLACVGRWMFKWANKESAALGSQHGAEERASDSPDQDPRQLLPDSPDFGKYSADELRQILTRIDRDRFPQRVEEIESRLAELAASVSNI